jgi:hypothetical protein
MMLQCDTRALGCSVDRVSAEFIVPTFPQPLIVIATIAVLTSKKILPTTEQARSIARWPACVTLSTRRERLWPAFAAEYDPSVVLTADLMRTYLKVPQGNAA